MTATPTTANSAILRASMIPKLAQSSLGRTNTPLPAPILNSAIAASSADCSSGLAPFTAPILGVTHRRAAVVPRTSSPAPSPWR